MTHTTYVWRDGQLQKKQDVPPLECTHVIRDQMDDTWHPANGKKYDSKSAFRRATRDAGCIEVGNEPLNSRRAPERLDNRQRRQDIQRSIYQLRNGHG